MISVRGLGRTERAVPSRSIRSVRRPHTRFRNVGGGPWYHRVCLISLGPGRFVQDLVFRIYEICVFTKDHQKGTWPFSSVLKTRRGQLAEPDLKRALGTGGGGEGKSEVADWRR